MGEDDRWRHTTTSFGGVYRANLPSRRTTSSSTYRLAATTTGDVRGERPTVAQLTPNFTKWLEITLY